MSHFYLGMVALGLLTVGAYATTNFPEATSQSEMDAKKQNGCYQISTVADLYAFAGIVNADGYDYDANNRRACGELQADITVNNNVLTTVAAGETPTYNWLPIKDFRGIFLGHGHTISGLYATVSRAWDGDASAWVELTEKVGLFEEFNAGSVIVRNVHIADSYFEGSNYVGGIVGNVYNANVVIDSCSFNGLIKLSNADWKYAGGIAGYVGSSNLLISNSEVTTTVTSESGKKYAGFAAGLYNSTIEVYNSTNTSSLGDVVDGSLTTLTTFDVSNYNADMMGKLLVVDPELVALSGVSIAYSNENKVVATLSDASGSLSIPQDIAVDTVVLDRAFDTELSSSTVMLPFEIAAANVENAEFFNVIGVTSAGGTAKIENSTIEAYKPYLVKPSQSAITFKGAVTLKQTSGDEEESYIIGDWSFRGRITNKTWLEADVDGKAYTYSPKALSNGIAKGEFAKIGKNVRVRTMRAYLYYTGDAEKPLAKPAADAMLMSTEDIAVEDLPSTIPMTFIYEDIVVSQDSAIASIEGEDNGTLAIEKISTQMPAVSSDRWFDLKGRRLNGRPQTRGTYLHNKTLVTIK